MHTCGLLAAGHGQCHGGIGSAPELGVFERASSFTAHLAAHFGVKLDRVRFASVALGDGIHDRHEGVFPRLLSEEVCEHYDYHAVCFICCNAWSTL